jgi:hypothetical protein
MTEVKVARLRTSLEDWEPEIWRVVEVPMAASLKMVHDVVQAAMGWQDCHLWAFEAAGKRYGPTDPGWSDEEFASAKKVKLGALIDSGAREWLYTYDMGDDWRHIVKVESVGPSEAGFKYPRFVAGAGRCPPEDVGGLPGFDYFLEAMTDPAHEEHAELLAWYGGPFDPEEFDERAAELRVAAIAKRRANPA